MLFLKAICVGTGRDGTSSVAKMLQYSFDKEGLGQKTFHEWLSVFFYNNWCDSEEKGDPSTLQHIKEALERCDIDCIVGNGYATILPLIAELSEGNTCLIHLKRKDRLACIKSLAENALLFPANHRYYAPPSNESNGKRMAAFHFGEVLYDEWMQWTLEQKFAWYYDKTHQLIDDAKPLFKNVLEIETESLSDESTRKALADALGIGNIPPAVHVNKHVDLRFASDTTKVWIQNLLGRLDVARLDEEPAYGLEHFLHEFVAFAEDSIARTNDEGYPGSTEEVFHIVNKAQKLLAKYQDELKKISLFGPQTRGITEAHKLKSATDKEALAGELASLKLELDKSAIDKEALAGKLHTIGVELEDIQNSKSWRITAPLRRIMTELIRFRCRIFRKLP